MLSTFKPSGVPGSVAWFRSAKMLRSTMLPAASSLIAWMYCEERIFVTYIMCSSGEAQSFYVLKAEIELRTGSYAVGVKGVD